MTFFVMHVKVATLEAAVTYLQQLLPGKAMTQGRAYRDPELLRTISMDRTRSGAIVAQLTVTLLAVTCI